jgi:hypothetical protein
VKLPTNSHVWLGLALVVGITFLGIGGMIAAVEGNGPTDGMITAITSMLSAIIGGLIGYSAAKVSDKEDRDV